MYVSKKCPVCGETENLDFWMGGLAATCIACGYEFGNFNAVELELKRVQEMLVIREKDEAPAHWEVTPASVAMTEIADAILEGGGSVWRRYAEAIIQTVKAAEGLAEFYKYYPKSDGGGLGLPPGNIWEDLPSNILGAVILLRDIVSACGGQRFKVTRNKRFFHFRHISEEETRHWRLEYIEGAFQTYRGSSLKKDSSVEPDIQKEIENGRISVRDSGEILLYTADNEEFSLGAVREDGSYHTPSHTTADSLEGDVSSLIPHIKNRLRAQFLDDSEMWHRYSERVYLFALSDKPAVWLEAFMHFVNRMNFDYRCSDTHTYLSVWQYADVALSLSEGGDPFEGDMGQYLCWQDEMKSWGLDGFPKKPIERLPTSTSNLYDLLKGDLKVGGEGTLYIIPPTSDPAFLGEIKEGGAFTPSNLVEGLDKGAFNKELRKKLLDLLEEDDWYNYPEDLYRFLLDDRPPIYVGAFLNYVEFVGSLLNPEDFAYTDAHDYAAKVLHLSMMPLEKVFESGEEGYVDWQLAMETLGLEGYPIKEDEKN